MRGVENIQKQDNVDMKKRNDSRSHVQQDIEGYVIERVRKILDIEELVSNPKLILDEEAHSFIRPDFFSESEKIIGEIHSHLGRLKPAQQNKIASDVLKMILYDMIRGYTFRKYIIVCGKEEDEQLRGRSYLAEAIRKYEITVLYVPIPEESHKLLQEAMKRQNLMDM